MNLDNSNKRYSHFIAGILIISVASIFLVCASGIWEHKVISNYNPLTNGLVMTASNRNNIMENNHMVIPPGVDLLPINEKICKVFDTEKGWLYFDQSNIPTTFPLTITQTMVDAWDVIVYAHGGYEFKCGEVDLWQKGEWKGELEYDVETVVYGATVDAGALGIGTLSGDYVVDIYTLNLTITSGTQIDLDSNYVPSLYDSGWMRVFDGPCPGDLGKEVKFKEKMKWSGCHLPDQDFRVILAYKCMLRSPKLPIKNIIASFWQ
ncbi:MAG: hypothetical protein ACFE75_07530 [Candidatus Hodarchaeota archaeon]